MTKGRELAEVEFFILNVSVLPPSSNTREFYSRLIQKYFRKKMPLKLGNDFYFIMTRCSPLLDGKAYYCVISKFLQLDSIEWLEEGTEGEVSEFEIPGNIQGRKSSYELIFFPEVHKIAFIKKGKLSPDVRKKGAPLQAISKILQMGFEQVIEDNQEVIVDVVQSQQIFDKIFESTVLRLDLTIHYTNPSTNGDHEEFMDGLLKESRIGKAKFSLTPDTSGSIDTNEKFVNGSLGIAKENGFVKAKIQTDEGIETINTRDYPEVFNAEVPKSNNTFSSLITKIIEKLWGNHHE